MCHLDASKKVYGDSCALHKNFKDISEHLLLRFCSSSLMNTPSTETKERAPQPLKILKAL